MAKVMIVVGCQWLKDQVSTVLHTVHTGSIFCRGQGNLWNRAQHGQKALVVAMVLSAPQIRLLILSKKRLGKVRLPNHAKARLTV